MDESSALFLFAVGLWLVGLSEILACDAFVRTESSVRPNFNPMTRVGVFCLLRDRSCETSDFVQLLPEFLLYLAIRFSFRLGIDRQTRLRPRVSRGSQSIHKLGLRSPRMSNLFPSDQHVDIAAATTAENQIVAPNRMSASKMYFS